MKKLFSFLTFLLLLTFGTLKSQVTAYPAQVTVCPNQVVDYVIIVYGNSVHGLTFSASGGGANANNGATSGSSYCGFFGSSRCPFPDWTRFVVPIKWSSSGSLTIEARDGNGNILSSVTCSASMSLPAPSPYLSGPSTDYRGTLIYQLNDPCWRITGVSFGYNSTGASISELYQNNIILENLVPDNYYVYCFDAVSTCGESRTICNPLHYGSEILLKQNPVTNQIEQLRATKEKAAVVITDVGENQTKEINYTDFTIIWDDKGTTVKNNMGITIYPNPVSKESPLNITINGMSGSTKYGSVYNLQGKLVKQFKMDENNTSTALNFDELCIGMYVLKMQSTAGQVSTKFSVQ